LLDWSDSPKAFDRKKSSSMGVGLWYSTRSALPRIGSPEWASGLETGCQSMSSFPHSTPSGPTLNGRGASSSLEASSTGGACLEPFFFPLPQNSDPDSCLIREARARAASKCVFVSTSAEGTTPGPPSGDWRETRREQAGRTTKWNAVKRMAERR
jgi:hypothetical protein